MGDKWQCTDVLTDFNAHFLLSYSNVVNRGIKILQDQCQRASVPQFPSSSVQRQIKKVLFLLTA